MNYVCVFLNDLLPVAIVINVSYEVQSVYNLLLAF